MAKKITGIVRPTSVKIGSRIYTIKWDGESVDRAKLEATDATMWAATKHRDLLIVIDGSLAPYNQRCSLLHELLHCLFHLTGAEPATEHLLKAEPDVAEELMVSRLEEPLMSLLLDNPKLLAYLLDR